MPNDKGMPVCDGTVIVLSDEQYAAIGRGERVECGVENDSIVVVKKP